MPKKIPIKKSINTKKISSIKPKLTGASSTEKILVENFVALQKVMTNLSSRFDELSGQISKLLELFEISAKTISEKGPNFGNEKEGEKISEKLDNLVEQNKVIARGLTLLHEASYPQLRPQNKQPMQQPLVQRSNPPQQRMVSPPPLSRNPLQQSQEKPVLNRNEYQKSISSKQRSSDEAKNK